MARTHDSAMLRNEQLHREIDVAQDCRCVLIVLKRPLERYATQTATNALLARFGFNHFLAAVVTRWADVMTTMHFARRRLNAQIRRGQKVMRTMHAALRR
jgi:hypothetical protein